MGQITALFVQKVLQIVQGSLDPEALLAEAGIDSACMQDAGLMVAASAYYTLLERLAQVDPDPVTLPLRAGAAMRCDDYGAFGLAWKSARTLRGSFERAERYGRVLTSVTRYQVEQTEKGAWMHLHRGGERILGLRLSNEASLAAVLSISRQVSDREIRPLEVRFRHPAPRSIVDHEAWFGCPVSFEADRDALRLSAEDLARPNRLGDEGLTRFFENHLEGEMEKLGARPSVEARLRQALVDSLSEGVPRIATMAEGLGLSTRSLQRSLARQGFSYQALVDDTRRQLACGLLRESGYGLNEIAFMAGFSDQSAFTRAFRRWEGRTPRSYRLDALPPA